MNKFTKIITFFLIFILLSFNIYNLYALQNINSKIDNLNQKLADNTSEEEYLSLYEELVHEIGDISNIEDKIGLLQREYRENDEGLTLSIQDLEMIKNQNNEIEKQIIQLENKKKEEEQNNINFPTFNQFPEYPTGCESVALYLLLNFYEVNVSVEDIVSNLKKGPLPYKNNGQVLGGNPEIEFIDYDYDLDEKEVEKWNVGTLIPVMIFLNEEGKEIFRLNGEKSKKEIVKVIEELRNEKN